MLPDDVNIPLSFTRIQAADLVDWSGRPEDPRLEELVRAISRVLSGGRPPKKASLETDLSIPAGRASASQSGDSDERVHFTVYQPQAVSVEKQFRLLAYAHTAGATSSIEAHAGGVLKDLRESFEKRRGIATVDIKRGAPITVAPYLPGCRFEPRIVTFPWLKEWHSASFVLCMERVLLQVV